VILLQLKLTKLKLVVVLVSSIDWTFSKKRNIRKQQINL